MSFLIAQAGFAQSKTITGRVTSADDGSPLIGVSVVVKGTTNGASTDVNGGYSIEAAQGSTLVFSYIGMLPQEQTVGTGSTINVAMRSDAKVMEEVVVVGYGTQMKSNVTGAISTVDPAVLDSRPVPDVARGLQGTVPGLTITTASGQIGATPSIKLRAFTGTLTGTGGAQPLILVDNVEIPDLQMINPDDIESISVLKDAASSSIYGARGAWGVILITTKSGKRGAPARVTYSNNFSWSKPTQIPEIAPSVEGAEVAFLARRRVDPSATLISAAGVRVDETAIQKMREYREQYGDGSQFGLEMVEGRDYEIREGGVFFYRPWDVNDLFIKEWAPQQTHNLSVSGGSDKTNYNLSASYLGQQGVYKVNPDNFKRYTINMGVNTSVTDWLDIRGKFLYSRTTLTAPFMFSSATYDYWHYLYRWPAISPYGTINGRPFRNAITEVQQAKMNETNENFNRINVGATFKPVKGLTVDVDYTYGRKNDDDKQVGGSITALNHWNGITQSNEIAYQTYTSSAFDRVSYSNWWNNRHTGRAFATYSVDVNQHAFKFILGGDVEQYENWYLHARNTGLMDPNAGELSLTNGTTPIIGGAHGNWATLGTFGRFNYAFKNKYLLELNARYDGSSRLSPTTRWGFFPSMSAGYVLTEEPFMEFARPVLSFLKVRGSWGSIGNENTSVGNIYSIMPKVNSGWLIAGVNQPTAGTPQPFDAALTWETVTTLDFGLDTRFFNDRFGIGFDWYRRTTSDMFAPGLEMPSTFGTTAPRRNFGELRTQGWEFAVDFKHAFGNGLNINATAVLSDFQEKIISYPAGRLITNNYEGRTLGEIWGYETDRFFTEDDFQKDADGNIITVRGVPQLIDGIPDQTFLQSGALRFGPGDVKYKDLNGDGKIDQGDNSIDNPGDKKVIGNTTPRYQYSLRLGADFKGIDFSMFLQGVGARDYWATGQMYLPGWRAHEAWYTHQLDYWTPENPNAFYPRPTQMTEASVFNFQPQTKYLLDLSYLRVKNVQLGYTIPKVITTKAKIQRLRVYLSGENVFTFDNLNGVPIDPEINVTSANLNDQTGVGRVYPYRTSYSVGVQITL
ncbi:SusC/RagA family TonB-linked outer membrane protein [Rufibacter roseus]|uniref:SusC/RagA family TonB-linked outer membrane protein n=2 Tax=Rufibacter roseus TaxID=1567108 RepID=A0ABW2DIK7_9BACT|nr:TonB-dependent receptor [Rufibacter roseus]